MARPLSKGMDYFPLDTDIDQDDKVALVEADHGIVGFGVIIKLFMKIYGNGYFYEWGEKEQKLFVRRVNVDINTLSTIVSDCIKWGIFDKDAYENHGVLTSRGIQKRFFEASSRRKEVEVETDLLLLNSSELENVKNLVLVDTNTTSTAVSVDINPPSAELMSAETTQSKVKESKVKESKEKHPSAVNVATETSFDKFWSVYPHKVDKGASRKKWDTIKPSAELTEQIVHAVLEQVKVRKAKDDLGIWVPEWKSPATWLNKECWLDEVAMPKASDAPSPRKSSNLGNFDQREYSEEFFDSVNYDVFREDGSA